MAAYAALFSLMNTIDLIQLHPRPPFRLNKAQVETLTEKITFLQEFLEGYSVRPGYNKKADPLEMRIADAAQAAEDVIDFHIVDNVHHIYDVQDMVSSFSNFFKGSRGPRKAATDPGDEVSPTDQFYQSLQRVIDDMDSLKKEVMVIKRKCGVLDLPLRNSMHPPSLGSSSGQNVNMVGFDDILVEVLDKLTGGQLDRQVIPIVGMGGTGKTTLARNIYHHQVVVQHFDCCAWVTVSQEYRMREILLELLQEVGGGRSESKEHALGDQLHKKLFARRYLIIVDDIWDIHVLDELRRFFPDNKNGSRIVITTRISKFESTDSYVRKMGFLNEDKSWTLFSKIVFGENGCPNELEEIGKKIVDNCRGLPLSIVVVGGLLKKLEHKQKYWVYIADNLTSIVNSENDESCLKILHLSYSELPLYLKPCFLYMGIFSEDKTIRVSKLIKLWVSEGFLRPIIGRTLEEVADEYFQELINRNLVLVHMLGCTGSIKYCKVHDLLRDLCLRQAERERFYSVISQDKSSQRRIVIPDRTSRKKIRSALKYRSHVRSLLCHSLKVPALRNFRLLRILEWPRFDDVDFGKEMFKFVNGRYLNFRRVAFCKFPSSFYLWSLQSIDIGLSIHDTNINIWNMPQLRHLNFFSDTNLADLRDDNIGDIILWNLQTVAGVRNFKCCEEVVRRIPNIKKLKLCYIDDSGEIQDCSGDEVPEYGVKNFRLLHKLESLNCYQPHKSRIHFLENIAFPQSLKKLTLSLSTSALLEGMLEKIGSLPLLEKLVLFHGKFLQGRWETVEGQFLSLKFLHLKCCENLKFWITDNTHFPRLEHLVLNRLDKFKDIPCEIGEIPTLKSIQLLGCNSHTVDSAHKIRKAQEELFGEIGLQVVVKI